jgi:hypothetical protein
MPPELPSRLLPVHAVDYLDRELVPYRVWFAAGLGLLAGVISMLVLSFIVP